MMEEDKLCSPKTFSAATSPIKDTLQLRYDSRELGKKLVSRDVQTDKYSAGGIFHSSSSSEKVQQAFFVEDAKLLIHQFVLSDRDRSNNGQYLNVLFGFKYFCELTNIFWFSVQVFGGKSGSRESNATKSTWGQITETVKEKLETVGRRGRRYSKEQGERWAPCGSGDSDHFLLQHLLLTGREMRGLRVDTTACLVWPSPASLTTNFSPTNKHSTRPRKRRWPWKPSTPSSTASTQTPC